MDKILKKINNGFYPDCHNHLTIYICLKYTATIPGTFNKIKQNIFVLFSFLVIFVKLDHVVK
jgi:hypothetical protein